MIARYFVDKQEALDKLQAEFETATQELETFIEENSGEDGLVEEAKTIKEKSRRRQLKTGLKQQRMKRRLRLSKMPGTG